MGISISKLRRRNRHHHQNPPLPEPPLHSSSSSSPPFPTTAATTTSPIPNNPIHSSSSSSSTTITTISPNNPSPPPPPPPPSYVFAANAPYPSHPNAYYPSNSYNYAPPFTAQFGYNHYYPNRSNVWGGSGPPAIGSNVVAVPPYVDHKSAKKIKNDVNVHKDTIRLSLDQDNLDSHLVSFTFDAVVDGSITIFYFAKEGANCTFTPLYPDIYRPRRISFQKGLGQKFCQPTGTGIDLGFFEIDELSRPSPKEDVFPLVISAETCLPSHLMDEHPDNPLPTLSPHAQITEAVLERNNEGHFQVRVIKQILWVDAVRYELREIYGLGNADATGFDDIEPGKECVICMTEPKDTAVLPCRHMCMCSGCAKALMHQSNKCPICRQFIGELIEIKVDKASS